MITDDDLADMAPRIQATMQTPGWADYVRVVEEKVRLTKEAAIEDDPSMLLYHRGSIHGLLAAVLSANDILVEVRRTTGEKEEVRRRVLGQRISASTFE